MEIDAGMTTGPLGTMISAVVMTGGGAAVPVVGPVLGPALGVGKLVSDHRNRQHMDMLRETLERVVRRGTLLAGAGLALQAAEVALKFYELATYEKRLDQ